MNLSKESSISKESIAAVGLAFALTLGSAACTAQESHRVTHAVPTLSPAPSVMPPPTPSCSTSLELFTVFMNTQAGGAYATNEGDCVNVYSHEVASTSGVIGHIAADGKFYIECYDLTASGLRVTMKGSKGLVDLTDYALQQLDEDPSAQRIRTC